MKQLNQRLDTAKTILKQVEHEPARYNPIVKNTMKKSTPWRTYSCFQWLKENNYIKRVTRGTYMITEKGRNLLNAI